MVGLAQNADRQLPIADLKNESSIALPIGNWKSAIGNPSPAPRRALDVHVEHVLGLHFHLVVVVPSVPQRPDSLGHLVDREGLALHLVQALGVDEEAVSEQAAELAEVQLGNEDAL